MPNGAKKILSLLQKAGYEAYVVGGCVRDSLLGREPHDWDICTNALPDQVEECLSDYKIIETGLKHGTVTVLADDGAYEITTYRVDGEYTDHRRPDSVDFTSSLLADLSRRDFTINAMAYNDQVGLVDFFDGQRDLLCGGFIRCVGDANTRFQEDALRILRALRFAATYGFSIASGTRQAAFANVNLLDFVSAERIRDEFCKLIVGKDAAHVLMRYKGIITHIIPELEPCVGFAQNNPYHCYTVYDHIAHSVGAYDGTDVVVALALLLHDIGKPLCYVENETGGHFYGHAKTSHDVAKDVLERFRLDNKTKHDVLELILYHDLVTEVSARFVRKWLHKLGEEQFRRLMKVRRADVLAQSGKGREDRIAKCDAVEAMIDQLTLPPLT